jgi:cation-transporting P-type ATPase 13A2
VIACAFKKLEDQTTSTSREKLECSLTFLGFLIFENQLKPETAGAIEELKRVFPSIYP